MTAKTATVHERMVAIVSDLPAIGKNQENTQQHFKFRGIDDVLNALNPLLAKHGVFYLPRVLDRVDSERQTRSGSAMFVVNLHVEYTFFGAAGDSVTASAWGEGTDMGDKATPKAMTGAMKACLFQAFAISTEEASDPDQTTPEESTSKRSSRVPAATAPGGVPGEKGTVQAPSGAAVANAQSDDAREVTRLRRKWGAIAKGKKKTEQTEAGAICERWSVKSLDELDAGKWEAEIELFMTAEPVAS